MGLEIRKAVAGDLGEIEACAEAAYGKYVSRIGRAPAPMMADFACQVAADTVWVAAAGGALCGFAVYYAVGDAMFLENVAVSPAWQGHGVGRRLIGHVEDAAQALGLSSVELYTNVKMTENLVFYPRLGYREIDRRHEDGFDRVYFRKVLKPA